MAKPIIGYLSMLRLSTATVTDPGTESGYAIGSLYNMKAYNIWKYNTTTKPLNIDIDNGGSTQSADYVALVNHNLFTLGATVKIMADTFVTPTTQRMAATAVTEDTVSMLTFGAPVALRYWRIQITVAGASFSAKPFIGDIFLGLKTTLPEYLAPSFPPFFDNLEVSGNRSEGGQYLAATTRGHIHRGRLEFGAAGAARASFTSDLNAFIDNHAVKRQPFFFQLDSADTDFDAVRYIKMTDDSDSGRQAVGNSWGRLTFGLDVEEAYAEPVV